MFYLKQMIPHSSKKSARFLQDSLNFRSTVGLGIGLLVMIGPPNNIPENCRWEDDPESDDVNWE
jgi:hypothetical protein